jgi:hypothetical protein
MKWLLVLLLTLLLANNANGQSITQTYIDPCDNKVYTVTFPLPNNSVTIMVRGKIKTFTYAEAQLGAIQTWVNSIFTTPCPTNTAVQQAITNTVSQAASTAASSAATAASSAASGAASSASASASTSASSASTSGASSSSSSSSSSSQSSSSGGESSSSSSSTESKSESSSSSESSSESKEESKSESKEESKEEKKEEKKDEKKQMRMNPIMVNSDLTTAQTPDGKFVPIISLGMSQSSATGESSWGTSAMIFADLKSFALSANKSDLIIKNGELKAIKSYSYTYAWMNGIPMTFGGYTYIKPHPRYGTLGYNLSLITIKLKGNDDYSYQMMSSTTAFWTKPYKINVKSTISPGVFLMASPYSYNNKSGSTWNYNVAGLVGAGYTYQISKRFVFAIDYKLNASTVKGAPLLNFIMIGSRAIL